MYIVLLLNKNYPSAATLARALHNGRPSLVGAHVHAIPVVQGYCIMLIGNPENKQG
jgi:hypothetical protein